MADNPTATDDMLDVKKLRKKLRQIDNLERLGRPLNDEEKLRVSSKNMLRNELHKILSSVSSHENSQDTIPTANLISDAFDNDDDDTEDVDEFSNGDKPEETGDILDQSIPKFEKSSGELQCDDTTSQSPLKITNKRQCDDRVELEDPSDSLGQTSKPLKRLKSNSNLLDCSGRALQNANDDFSCKYKNNLENLWRCAEFTVSTLVGHNESIPAVAVDGNLVVSVSLDTSVRVWNGESGQNLCTLRGHTGGVTCLTLLSKEDGDELCRYLGLMEQHRVAITGSNDSSVIMWSLTSGRSLKSIYTFNTVTCLVYVASEVCIVTATDGGKIDIWDAVSGCNLRSLTMFDESYTCMIVKANFLYASSSDGIIKVWEICNRDLISRFTLEQLDQASGMDLVLRRIYCLEVYQDWIFYGDDGVNLKAFNWKTCEVQKYINHTCKSGATDGIVCTGQEIISSSYNLDTASGHLNVRLFPGGDYLCSLSDNNTGRINALACSVTNNGDLRIVTGGAQLKVWNVFKLPRNNKRTNNQTEIFKAVHIPYYMKQATHSDYESSDNESDESSQNEDKYERTYIPREVRQRSFWSLCTIL